MKQAASVLVISRNRCGGMLGNEPPGLTSISPDKSPSLSFSNCHSLFLSLSLFLFHVPSHPLTPIIPLLLPSCHLSHSLPFHTTLLLTTLSSSPPLSFFLTASLSSSPTLSFSLSTLLYSLNVLSHLERMPSSAHSLTFKCTASS